MNSGSGEEGEEAEGAAKAVGRVGEAAAGAKGSADDGAADQVFQGRAGRRAGQEAGADQDRQDCGQGHRDPGRLWQKVPRPQGGRQVGSNLYAPRCHFSAESGKRKDREEAVSPPVRSAGDQA
jgi:hypothetical protein